MTEKYKAILNSIGTYPPVFTTDYSIYRNCYSHALNCMFEDRDFTTYSPGAICAIFNGSDSFNENNYYFREDLLIKLLKRDCAVLSINAYSCNFDAKTAENAYKIAIAYSKSDNDFHFLRSNADGSWSHKPGFGNIFHRCKSEIINYRGEQFINLYGVPYQVIEICSYKKCPEIGK